MQARFGAALSPQRASCRVAKAWIFFLKWWNTPFQNLGWIKSFFINTIVTPDNTTDNVIISFANAAVAAGVSQSFFTIPTWSREEQIFPQKRCVCRDWGRIIGWLKKAQINWSRHCFHRELCKKIHTNPTKTLQHLNNIPPTIPTSFFSSENRSNERHWGKVGITFKKLWKTWDGTLRRQKNSGKTPSFNSYTIQILP